MIALTMYAAQDALVASFPRNAPPPRLLEPYLQYNDKGDLCVWIAPTSRSFLSLAYFEHNDAYTAEDGEDVEKEEDEQSQENAASGTHYFVITDDYRVILARWSDTNPSMEKKAAVFDDIRHWIRAHSNVSLSCNLTTVGDLTAWKMFD